MGASLEALQLRSVGHAEMSRSEIEHLRHLFDAEYLKDFGVWNPDQSYGYAPHDVHVMAVRGEEAVGHIGWGLPCIRVGTQSVRIAGVGGVLVSPSARGLRLGQRLMSLALEEMHHDGAVDFGYLGCREEVAPFYASCGWHRISEREHSLDRLTGKPMSTPAGAPLFIFPISGKPWPEGEISLNGVPW